MISASESRWNARFCGQHRLTSSRRPGAQEEPPFSLTKTTDPDDLHVQIPGNSGFFSLELLELGLFG
jgi:hypothetical protein